MGKFTVHQGAKIKLLKKKKKNLREKKKVKKNMQSELKNTCVFPSSTLSQAATAQVSDRQDKAGVKISHVRKMRPR